MASAERGSVAAAGEPIYAVIGVRRSGPLTWYVRRSMVMANYPGVWSLVSIQHGPGGMADPRDLDEAAGHFRRMSNERLGGVGLRVVRFLTQGSSKANPMGVDVALRLYELEFDAEPALDPAYYREARWMSAAEYEEVSAGQPCGLCTRLWADFAWMAGVTDRPFIARPAVVE